MLLQVCANAAVKIVQHILEVLMQKLKIVVIVFSVFIFGCTPFSSEQWAVKQGNVIPESKIKRLKVGMSKDEVAILIGNSLVNSPFNDNRWDYTYLWGNAALDTLQKKNLSLYFSNDNLVKIERG